MIWRVITVRRFFAIMTIVTTIMMVGCNSQKKESCENNSEIINTIDESSQEKRTETYDIVDIQRSECDMRINLVLAKDTSMESYYEFNVLNSDGSIQLLQVPANKTKIITDQKKIRDAKAIVEYQGQTIEVVEIHVSNGYKVLS